MRDWRKIGVDSLRAALVYFGAQSTDGYAGTIEFDGDPRAIPVYMTFRFLQTPHGLRMDEVVSGLKGTTYANTNWQVTRTAHFRVFHSPYDLHGADRRFLGRLEHERQEFIRKFGLHPLPVADYYFYPRQRMMAPLTGGLCGTSPDFVGCALTDKRPPEIHTSEWPSYHEPIHVFQISMEPKRYVAPNFIAEGMAVALEDRDLDPEKSDYCSEGLLYVPLDECASHVVHEVKATSLLSDRGFQKGKVGDAYLMGGSFVKYLIVTYGYRAFGRFYYVLAAQPKDRVRDYNVASGRVYHRSIETLLRDWQRALCAHGCR